MNECKPLNPGIFYTRLGGEIAARTRLVIPNHEKVAWWCYREASEVHTHPEGMAYLAACYARGRGVTEDPAQAAVWLQKAADLGNPGAQANLANLCLTGDARAGVAKDAARAFGLLREAFAAGFEEALLERRGRGEGRCTRGVSSTPDHLARRRGDSRSPAATWGVLHHGRPVQVDPMKPTLKAPGINRLKL